jgi:hypothetical protein
VIYVADRHQPLPGHRLRVPWMHRACTNEHPFTIRCADQDDIIPVHRFLCLVAQPVLMAPIDAEDSIAG